MRREHWKNPEFPLPVGDMRPIAYLMQQHGVHLRRPVRAYDRWFRRMPAEYARSVLDDASVSESILPEDDPNMVAAIKHFRSLVALGQEARKPIFSLTPADGAMGAHSVAANAAYKDFEELSKELLRRMAGFRSPGGEEIAGDASSGPNNGDGRGKSQ